MQLPVNIAISGGLPQSGVPAFRLIDDELRQVKELIDEQLAGVPAKRGPSSSSVGRLFRRINIHGGKMLRPGLVLLSYRVVRDASCEKKTQYDIRNTQYEAIRVAAIVEIIHNATLLHDDVIDEGQKRRGGPTINSLCGNESAVLLGDFLLSRVFKMCADLQPQVTKIIASAAGRTCEGELRQITQRRNWQLDESEYIDIITEKSAALFSGACLLGGLLACGSEVQVRSLSDFGLNTGIAFQITDDLLDVIGDEGETGKTLGSDVDKNKLTLATIHLLRTVDESGKDAVINVVCDKGAPAEMLRRYGSLEYAHIRAQEFVSKAIGSLAGLRESEAKNALIETARLVLRSEDYFAE